MLKRSMSASILHISRAGSIKSETLEERRRAVKQFPSPPAPRDGRKQQESPSKGRAVSVSSSLRICPISGSHGRLTSGLQTMAMNKRLILILNMVEDWLQFDPWSCCLLAL